MSTYYINGKPQSGPVETVDEFTDRKEALRCLKEYRLGFWGWDLWISKRSTKDWRERESK